MIRGAQIGALALLLVLCAGNVACKKGGSSTSTSVISVSGGDANSPGGNGGWGSEVDFWIYYGGAGSIDVQSSGSVDASFTPSVSFTPELGANPLVVTSDLSILVVTSAPGLGIPYTIEGDWNLYVSDGDMDLGDETPVTGLQVQAGVTVTLGLNIEDDESPSPDTGGLVFSDDIVNDGAITVVDLDTEQRGSIDLYTDGDYIGSGRIETFGTIPGQYGGHIYVTLLGNGYNSGDWGSYGADQTDGEGGTGGDIIFWTGVYDYDEDDFEPGGLIENTGNMNSSGGVASGATGFGGSAGWIYILPYLSLSNSGDLNAIGGDGVGRGGRGGDIVIAGSIRGELRNTGDLMGDGGDASDGYAGDGGDVSLGASGGELRSSGVMLSRGGDSSSDGEGVYGGFGGAITFSSYPSDDDYEESAFNIPAGDIWFSGGAVATGGDSQAIDGSGGSGGYISFEIANELSQGNQAIHVLGIEGIYTQGGDGDLEGGPGRNVYFDLAFEDGTATGLVNVESPMNTSGGDADPDVMGSEGGNAGNIWINAGAISYGTATAEGGTGETPGADGMITPETMLP